MGHYLLILYCVDVTVVVERNFIKFHHIQNSVDMHVNVTSTQ